MESAHLLLGTLQMEPPDATLEALLQISGLKAEEVRLYAQSAPRSQKPLAPGTSMSDSVRRTIRIAGKEAYRTNSALVDVSHFFVACFNPRASPELAAVLAPLGVSAPQLSLHLRQLMRGKAAKSLMDESPLAHLTAHGQRALEVAEKTMRAQFCGRISTLHLLIGVLENSDSEAVAALQTLMIDGDELKRRAAVAAVGDGEIAGPNRRFTPATKRALDRAKAAARDGGRAQIGSADLLLGLLPQPTLLIERAQFGARPDDPAAAVLREVDADLVRAIFNPRPAATPPDRPASSPEVASTFLAKWFAVFFGAELAICLAVEALGAWQKGATRSNTGLVLVSLLVAILVGSGLFACAMLIFSRNSSRKAACQWSFFGALTGALTGMALSGAFK